MICEGKAIKQCTHRIKMKHLISKIWSKIARRVRKLARQYVLLIMRYVIFPIISLAGSKMVLEKPEVSSLWLSWGGKSGQELISKQPGENWIIQYLSWTFKKGNSKNHWAIFLLPFILILQAAEEPGDGPSPESLMIYTLF